MLACCRIGDVAVNLLLEAPFHRRQGAVDLNVKKVLPFPGQGKLATRIRLNTDYPVRSLSRLSALERDHNPEIALRYAERYIKVFEDTPLKPEQAIGKRLIAKVYAELGTNESLSQAQELLRESVEVLRSISNKHELGLSCYESGLINRKLGQDTEAEEYLVEAKSIFKSLRLPRKIKKVEEALKFVLATTQCVGQ
jgi:tetratricopeptide (TPR) repeat protein